MKNNLSTLRKKEWTDPSIRIKRLKELRKAAKARKKRGDYAQPPKLRKQISETLQDYFSDPKNREKARRATKLKWKDPKFRKRATAGIGSPDACKKRNKSLSITLKKKWKDPQYREKMLKIHRSKKTKKRHQSASDQNWKDPKYRSKLMKVSKLRWTPEARRKVGKVTSPAMLKNWANPEYARKQLTAQKKQPNKSELWMKNLLQKLLLNYKINVLGEVLVLAGKIPDFVDIQKKKIIEVWGERWHKLRKESPGERIDFFKKLEWDCLVITSRKIKKAIKNEKLSTELKRKILEFTNR